MTRLFALLVAAVAVGACAQPVPIAMPGVRYVVPTTAIDRVPLPPVPAAPAPPPQGSRPAAVTTCDPGGCWDSDGRRLNSVGPQLIAPRGRACNVQAGVVLCP
jgi:hypothetical protein